jgi:hypothetical protein
MDDNFEALERLHEGIHALVDRAVAYRAALLAHDFPQEVADAMTVQYNAVIMRHLSLAMEAQRAAMQTSVV